LLQSPSMGLRYLNFALRESWRGGCMLQSPSMGLRYLNQWVACFTAGWVKLQSPSMGLRYLNHSYKRARSICDDRLQSPSMGLRYLNNGSNMFVRYQPSFNPHQWGLGI